MQTVSTQFSNITSGSVRHLSWALLISFLKDYDADITFFTIGESLIGGPDIIKGEGDVVQEWDKYSYDNYSDRIIGFEYTHEVDKALGGATMGMADVKLRNDDRYFTPNGGSAIAPYILPRRPIKLYAGFKGENIPVFVGMVEKMPNVNSQEADFHCIDFMKALFDIPLDESVIYEGYRTDQILDELLQNHAGLAADQYDLDDGYNIVKFFYANKGDKLGEIIQKLVQAELGSLYMDENGVIRFINRINWNDKTEAWVFDDSNIVDIKTPSEDGIINVVEVRSNVREVMANQKIWELFEPIAVPANGTVEIWADFDDPVTTIDEPEYIASATSSLYSTNYQQDGSGPAGNSHIALDSATLFSTSYKMMFSNDSASTIYITGIDVYGTPAKITSEIYVREEDAASIVEFEQRIVQIENDYLQDETTARSLANIILNDNNDYGDVLNMRVKGVPQLQIGDMVSVDSAKIGITDTFYVQKITGRMMDNSFTQDLTLIKKTFEPYFTIGVSTIGGDDKIAP